LTVINETPPFAFDADFNQISLVLAKCRYWQAMFSFGMLMFPHYKVFCPGFLPTCHILEM